MLTVLMATYNGAQTLPAVLQAYTRLHWPEEGWQLLVVDNGSDDATPDILRSFHGRLPLVRASEPRRGKNVALNRGLGIIFATSEPRLVVFTDDDATPEPDWLLQFQAAADQEPGYAVFGGSIAPRWGAPPPAWILRLVPQGLTYGVTDSAMPEGPVHPGLVWGANMAIRGEVFAKGFRFDENLGPRSGEYVMGGEVSLTRRLHAAGWQSWFRPGARVHHFIRPYQLSRSWVLARARRYGRGAFHQACRGLYPEWCGVPRWMIGNYLREWAGLALDYLRLQRDSAFQRHWELAYLHGYFREAWRARGEPRKRRIVLTSYSGELGGMELRMLHEARALRALGYDCVLAPRRFAGDLRLRAMAMEHGVALHDLKLPPVLEQWAWRRWNRLRAVLQAAPRLRRLRADLLHIALCWTTYGASALWLAGLCRLPVVLSVHNAFTHTTLPAWQQRLMRPAFGAVRGVSAVSASAMQHFLSIYGAWLAKDTRLAVIPNSVDVLRFRPDAARRQAARAAWGISAREEVIGCVGRLSEQKQPARLLRIFQRLAANRPGLRLVFIGSGHLEPELRRLATRAGLERRIVFAGFCEHVENVLPALDIHVLLSVREGFGIATVEAMACGIPAIATRVPGNADVLSDSGGGVLVEPDDDAGTAATVARLLDAPALRLSMGRRGREEVLARYADDVVRQQLERFYRDLA